MADPLLSALEVTVNFGGLVALDRVDLDVAPGSITGLIGPNGAGKTTLFNVVTGLQQPTRGQVLLDGRNITRWPAHRRARAGVARTFQRLELFVGMSVRDNLMAAWEAAVPGGVFGRRLGEGRARVDEVMTQVGLTHVATHTAGDLPTGLGRMVELGRALCTDPKLLLLDEPSSGLDANETTRFRDLLLESAGHGVEPAVLLVEHDMRLVMEVCDQITVLDFGKGIACGPPDAVRNDPAVIAAYLGETAGVSAPLLELERVSVSYGGLRALSEINLVIPEGCVVALLGANGAGKTTTLRTISGLVRCDHGRLRFRGRDIHRAPPHTISGMGIVHVPEGRGIFRSLTVAENLLMATYARLPGTPDALIDHAVDLFPVLGDRLQQLAGTLSGGEQQMLALARALVVRPRLLLLDEISMGLAPRITLQLFDTIRESKASGTSMLLVEQYVDATLELADYGYVLEKGRVVEMGEPDDLRASSALTAAYLGVEAG